VELKLVMAILFSFVVLAPINSQMLSYSQINSKNIKTYFCDSAHTIIGITTTSIFEENSYTLPFSNNIEFYYLRKTSASKYFVTRNSEVRFFLPAQYIFHNHKIYNSIYRGTTQIDVEPTENKTACLIYPTIQYIKTFYSPNQNLSCRFGIDLVYNIPNSYYKSLFVPDLTYGAFFLVKFKSFTVEFNKLKNAYSAPTILLGSKTSNDIFDNYYPLLLTFTSLGVNHQIKINHGSYLLSYLERSSGSEFYSLSGNNNANCSFVSWKSGIVCRLSRIIINPEYSSQNTQGEYFHYATIKSFSILTGYYFNKYVLKIAVSLNNRHNNDPIFWINNSHTHNAGCIFSLEYHIK
jgi:hypothetical protein